MQQILPSNETHDWQLTTKRKKVHTIDQIFITVKVKLTALRNNMLKL